MRRWWNGLTFRQQTVIGLVGFVLAFSVVANMEHMNHDPAPKLKVDSAHIFKPAP